jgi:hypothetical protein
MGKPHDRLDTHVRRHADHRKRRAGLAARRTRRGPLAALGLAFALALGAGGGSALASPPSLTLSGEAFSGITPDSFGFSTIAVSATKTGSVVGGTLETGGRTGGVDDTSHYEFTGTVNCMLMSKGHMIVGAFGTVAFVEEVGATKNIIPQPGTYMQVAEIQFVNYKEFGPGGEFTVRHEFGSLGEHHQGELSTVKPKCPAWTSLTASSGPVQDDSLALSPSITTPKDGFVSASGTVKFAGQGEPGTVVALYPVGKPTKAVDVTVNSLGRWSVTVGGLTVGSHEYVAQAVGGSTVLSNTVKFKVS